MGLLKSSNHGLCHYCWHFLKVSNQTTFFMITISSESKEIETVYNKKLRNKICEKADENYGTSFSTGADALTVPCKKKLDFFVFYLIKWVFLAEGFELLKSCHPYGHMAPNSVKLEASKKVLLIHVPQGAAKLQAVKLFSFFKNYIFLFMYHIFI